MKKMFKNKSIIIVIVLLVILVVSLLIGLYETSPQASGQEVKHVSMIVYGDDQERWENMREGADLVCADRDAKLSLLTTLAEDDPEEQKEIIDRELEDGTDALIIAPCSGREIKDYIDANNLKIPVIYLETVDSASPVDINIAPDDYMMGYSLGEQIVAEESDIVTVAVLSGYADRDSVRLREEGLRDAINGRVGTVLDWSGIKTGVSKDVRTYIQRAIVSEATDVIVSFDNTTTDSLLDALSNLNQSSKVYSISTSDHAVYDLYNGDIKVLEYTDEFSMGYLAAMYALDPKYASGRYSHKQIEYRMVRKENMYSEENQTLLFPFVD
ncbi:ABC-type sugar transport system, substrate-binding protein, contains N-terminal xre family HTH domain [Lachnospiraceae bacterium XBB2008]|nr:ABC-type sugar transport system, substrate-binding protein, contains N-terminal xre family HTH domain [Lachnospiraceae bacterium XBB2008]